MLCKATTLAFGWSADVPLAQSQASQPRRPRAQSSLANLALLSPNVAQCETRKGFCAEWLSETRSVGWLVGWLVALEFRTGSGPRPLRLFGVSRAKAMQLSLCGLH